MPAIELITLPKLGQNNYPDKALEEEHFAMCVPVSHANSNGLTLD
jgi:hypothetical protein